MSSQHPLAQFEDDFQEWIELETTHPRDQQHIDEVVARFWPALLSFVASLLGSHKFRHLRLNASDVLNSWYVATRTYGFRVYDRKLSFFPFAILTICRTCQNIRRYEKC